MTKMDIVRLCRRRSLRWTAHVLERMLRRNIRREDVVAALNGCEIIERYPTDYPFPSCLVLGFAEGGRPLHVVCGTNDEELWLITAYFPDPVEWTADFKRRAL